jgi:uncharacterized protein (UPF0335 family)
MLIELYKQHFACSELRHIIRIVERLGYQISDNSYQISDIIEKSR